MEGDRDIPADQTPWDQPQAPSVPADAPIMAHASAVAPEPANRPAPRAGGWTITLLCVGIALLACCIIIPQADANRRLAYQQQKLKADLEQIQKQAAVNEEFLKKVANDPTLAERLAQRQMKFVREGTSVLKLDGRDPVDGSPFLLVRVPPPPPQPPFHPPGGLMASICRNPQSRSYVMGAGLLLVACGLVLGYSPRR
ncbi:MAG: hypothetical protein IT446_10975 [Phycisphaerales bacterium]|nr:hypothetical protein [Phycisphaerales bacterium]